MKAIVVTDRAAGTAGMMLAERPEPPAAINDVVVQIHASGFVPTEMEWPSTWTDRAGRDRTPYPWARAGRSGHRPRLWHDGAIGGATGVRSHRLASRRHPGGICGSRGTQPRAAARRRRLHRGREPANFGTDGMARTVGTRPSSSGAEHARARRGRRSRHDG